MDKKITLDVISNLPDTISMEDIIEALYLRYKVQKGLKDFEEGRVISHEDLKKEISQW